MISSNTLQVVHADSFTLPPSAETVSQLVKSYENRRPTILIPRSDVKLWIGVSLLFIPTLNSIYGFPNLNCNSSLKQETAITTTFVSSVSIRTTLWPFDTSYFKGQLFLCLHPRGYNRPAYSAGTYGELVPLRSYTWLLLVSDWTFINSQRIPKKDSGFGFNQRKLINY